MIIRNSYDIDHWPEFEAFDPEMLIRQKAIRYNQIKSRIRKGRAEKEKKNESNNHCTGSKSVVTR